MILNILAVAFGGAIGSALRYFISLIPIKNLFPLQTFFTNLLGCFLIGIVTALASVAAQKSSIKITPQMILFLKTGICGGFTTFSTFALENANFITNKNPLFFALYAVASIFLGILCVFAGQNCIK